MLQLFLFLHVMGAIAVFGPTFAFPVIARHASREPQHGHFAAVVSEAIERRIVIPGAIVQGITGVALIFIIGYQTHLTEPAQRWLIAGIALYVIAVLYAVFIQAPAAEHMVEITAGGPPAGAPPAGAPAGPPPEIAKTAKKLQQGGMILAVLIVLIVLLMVVKPGF
jgi:uncharacterized membrane protein